MTPILALLLCVILAGLAIFQALLIAGLPWGRFAWGGQHAVLPPRLRAGSVIAIVLYAVFAVVALERANVTDLIPSEAFVTVAMWVIAGYLLLGVVGNLLSKSASERRTMTPIALVMGVLAVVIAAS